MSRLLITLAILVQSGMVIAQDPIDTDGDKYKVLLENERVRVLEYHDQPGAKTQQHRHPAFVLYALAPFKRTITLPDGKVITREFKRGELLWSDAQTHVGENIGQTDTQVIMIELKQDAQDEVSGK